LAAASNMLMIRGKLAKIASGTQSWNSIVRLSAAPVSKEGISAGKSYSIEVR